MTETKTNELDAAIKAAVETIKAELAKGHEERDALAAERARKEANELLEQKLEEYRKANPSIALPGVETDPTKKESFSLGRLVLSLGKNDKSLARYEHEVMSQTHKDMTLGTPSEGGNIVPPEYIPTLIEYLYKNTVCFKLGARRLENVFGSPVTIPKQTASGTGYWIATEGTTITESSQTFGQIEMTPHTLAAYSVISNTLFENSMPMVDSVVTRDLQRRLTISLDAGVLSGSGGSGQPTGITQVASHNLVDLSSTTGNITYDQLQDMIFKLDEDNALMGKLGWAMNPTVLHDIRKMRDGVSEYVDSDTGKHMVADQQLSRRAITDTAPNQVCGYDFATTTSLPATGDSIIFANWDSIVVPMWKGIEIEASRVAKDAFEKDQTHIRAVLRCDVGVEHVESICVGEGYGT